MTIIERPASPAVITPAPPTEREQGVVGRIARSGMWSMLAHAMTAMSAFVVSIIVARTLGPGPFGRYTFYLVLIGLLPKLLACGVPAAITKLTAERLGHDDEDTARALVRLGFRFHLAILPLAVVTCAWLAYGKHNHAMLAAAVAGGVGFGLLGLDLEGLMAASRRFHVLGVVGSIGAIFQVAVALGCALAHTHWESYVALQVSAIALSVAAYGWIGRHELFRRGRPVRELPPDLRSAFVRFSAVMCFTLLLDAVIWGRPELFFLARYHHGHELGYYSAALRLASVTTLPLMAAAGLLPEFARLRGAQQHAQLAETYPRVCRLMMLVTAPIAFGGAAIAGPLVLAAYGHRFDGAAFASTVLLAGGIVNAVAGPATAAVLTGSRPRLIAELGSIAAVCNLALDFWLIPRHGIAAAVFINVSLQLASVTTGVVYSWIKLGLRYPVADVARVLGIAAVAGAVAHTLATAVSGWPGLILAVGAAGAVYVLTTLITGVVSTSELRALMHRTPAPLVEQPA